MSTDASAAPVPLVTDPPAAPAATAAQPAAPIVPSDRAIASPPAEVKLTSEQLKQRLAEERRTAERQMLTRYGVERPEDLDAKLKNLAEFEASQLTDKERTEKQIAELTRAAENAKGLSTVAADAVQELFAALSPDAQAAIEELQPASPAERLKFIRAFRKLTPQAQPAISTPTAPPAAPVHAPPPAPANTAPAQPAPKPGGKTKYQEYEEIKARNNVAAGLFYQTNRQAIEASRPQA